MTWLFGKVQGRHGEWYVDSSKNIHISSCQRQCSALGPAVFRYMAVELIVLKMQDVGCCNRRVRGNSVGHAGKNIQEAYAIPPTPKTKCVDTIAGEQYRCNRSVEIDSYIHSFDPKFD